MAREKKKDNRDRREYLRNRRAEHAKETEATREAQGRSKKGDKRFPEGRRAQEDARANRGWSKVNDKDLQSPPGGTQREIWVKDAEQEDDD